MKGAFIVQARMTSRRLPGKVLKEVRGRPLLSYVLERLASGVKQRPVILATSNDPSDDALADFCRKAGIACHRGELQNVAARFGSAIEAYDLDYFIRVNADSPFLDPQVIEEAAAIHAEGSFDIVTNIFKRSFPKGESVEIFRSETFLSALNDIRDPEDQEHVTKYFYRNAARFRIFNLEAGHDYSAVNLSVDTAEDFERFERTLDRLKGPLSQYRWRDILRIQSLELGAKAA